MTVTFENGKTIANGEVEKETEKSAALSEGKVVSEAVAPVSVEVNGESIAVTFKMVYCLLHHFFVSLLHHFDILNHFNVDSISIIYSNILILYKSKKYV